MSKTDLAEATSKLAQLSDDRAQRVLILIQDLAELEALENRADLKAAGEALHEAKEPRPWQQVKAKLDAQYGSPQSAS